LSYDVSVPEACPQREGESIADVLSLLAGQLPVDGLEDVMVTFRRQLYMIRLVREDPEPQILPLVILDRSRVKLALARHNLRRIEADLSV